MKREFQGKEKKSYKMLINDLVIQLNRQMPNVEIVLNKFKQVNVKFSEKDAYKYLNDNLLSYHGSPVGDRVKDFIESTNISNVGIGSFRFNGKLKKIETGEEEFAVYNDFYRITSDNNGIIEIISPEEFNDREVLCPSFHIFSLFIIQYYVLDKNMVSDLPINDTFINESLLNLIEKGFSKRWLAVFLSEFNFKIM